METARGQYRTLCAELTLLRKKSAEDFAVKLKAELRELNFPQVDFQVRILSGEEYAGADGCDSLRFYISMNPGEKPRPLDEIAGSSDPLHYTSSADCSDGRRAFAHRKGNRGR